MITNFVSDIVASTANSASALPFRESMITYLLVSLLGPLFWIAAIEICRFVRAAKNDAPAGIAPAAALLIATRRQPATPGLMDSPVRES